MGEVSGIIKNIIAANQAPPGMPNIVGSPRNNPVGPSGVSIERINKNISDSISQSKGVVPHNKEIQLIQAYQHQKWKEQITQRSKCSLNNPVREQKCRSPKSRPDLRSGRPSLSCKRT